jgi:hypothetical protein
MADIGNPLRRINVIPIESRRSLRGKRCPPHFLVLQPRRHLPPLQFISRTRFQPNREPNAGDVQFDDAGGS